MNQYQERLAPEDRFADRLWPLSSAAAQHSSIDEPSWFSCFNHPSRGRPLGCFWEGDGRKPCLTSILRWSLLGRRRARTASYINIEIQCTVGWSISFQSKNMTEQWWPSCWDDCRHELKARELGYLGISDTIVPLDTQYTPLETYVKGR